MYGTIKLCTGIGYSKRERYEDFVTDFEEIEKANVKMTESNFSRGII